MSKLKEMYGCIVNSLCVNLLTAGAIHGEMINLLETYSLAVVARDSHHHK